MSASTASPRTVTTLRSRSTCTSSTPATCPTVDLMACSQCAQLTPGTEYVVSLMLRPYHTPWGYGSLPSDGPRLQQRQGPPPQAPRPDRGPGAGGHADDRG